MATQTQCFVLVGPHAGKTLSVNGHQFEDGEYTFTGSGEQVTTLESIFSNYAAVTVEEAERLAANTPPPTTNPVVTTKPATTPEQAPEGKVSLAEAVGALDPEVDAHWTSNNLPSLDHLAELTGKKVARGDVDGVADGYTRAKARSARAQ